MPTLSLLTGPVDIAAIRSTLNTLIQSINNGVTGVLYKDGSSSATGAGTSEQVLKTFSIPANYLAVGNIVRLRAWGSTGANANNKTMKLYFGASVITTPTAATNNKNWFLDMTVIVTAAATQSVAGTGIVDTTSVTPYFNAGTDDTTAAIVAKVSGTDGTDSAGDIACKGFTIEILR